MQKAGRPSPQIMIEDNLASDIQGGITMGYSAALRLTGTTSLNALKNSKLIPDAVFKT